MAEEEAIETIDLSSKGLKKLDKAVGDQNHAKVLILDDNELQRLDNVGTFLGLQKLSAVRNQLIRMYGVSKLHNLTSLNLAHNNLVGIEGLKELVNLRWLCLSGNNVKAIDHLNTNINLEHLDLSENNIGCISDLSHLQTLKELLLHGNRISTLQFCQKYLPMSLESLSLADNRIADLNEVSHVSHLPILREFTIAGNPCVAAATAVATHPHTPGQCVGFDYRPFVINWCMNLRVLDGYIVDAKESLRAEWLYSQGKGRSFRVGEQEALIVYLSSVCPPLLSSSSHPAKGLRPASAGSLGNCSVGGPTPDSVSFPPQSSSPLSEEDRKLLLILSKAQLHQKELREQQQQKTDKSDVSSISSGYGMSSSFTSVRSSSVGGSIQPTLEECESNMERGSKHPLDNGIKSRPSTAGPSFASPIVRRRTTEPPQRGSPKRCSSRSSCSREQQHQLHRRYSSTIGDMATSSSYNVELPVTLYGEDNSVDMVTSLDGGGKGGIGTWGGRSSKTFRANGEKENLMTRSLDPSLLSCSDNDTEKNEPTEPPSTGEDISSVGSSHRPKKLFSQSRVAGDSGMMDSTALKEDGNLEEFTEEGIENPLQTATKLVPVPESIVSPEYRPANSYMPTAPVRQGHMSNVNAEPERRRAQAWGSDRAPARPSSTSTSSHCYNHTQQNYYPAGNYSMNSTVPLQNMVGTSSNLPAGPSSSPGTRRANQNQQQHSSCSSSEASRCRHQHQNSNSSANVGANSSSAPMRGPPPAPSYFPASSSSNSTNPGSSRHTCHISSFYHNQVQPSQADCQSKNLQRTRRSTTRTPGDTSTPHSPAMSRIRRIPTSGRGVGAKIRKPAEGESVRGSSRASRGGAHGKSEKEGDAEGRESSGDNSDSEMSISKLEAIKCVAVERRHRKEDGSDLKDEKPIMDNPEKIKAAQEKAALKIQSLWRGYRYRKESKVDKPDEAPNNYQALKEEIQSMRVEDHIRLLSSELEATRGELGKERKLRFQQMEAIKALWKEVYSLQPKNVANCLQSPNEEGVKLPASSTLIPSADDNEQPAMVDAKTVAELTRTCANLQGQVQQLSESLQKVMQHISPSKGDGESNRDERAANTNAAIQTYISAVFTPQGPCASFPFGFKEEGEKKSAETQASSDGRPSYLPIFEERVKKVLKRPSEDENDSEGHLEEENEDVSEAKEEDHEEPPSEAVKHYLEVLVDGVLKDVLSVEDEVESSSCNIPCPAVFLSNE